MVSRVLAGRSTRELIDTKARLGRELRAAGYLYEGKTLIFSAISGISECGPVLVHSINDSDEDIGRSICDKLLESEMHEKGNPSESRVANWSAYIASGAKSARQFETNSLYLSFSTMNSAVIIKARHRVSLEPSFYVGADLSNGGEHEAFAVALRRLVKAVNVLRQESVL